jgi:hypothetical protein
MQVISVGKEAAPIEKGQKVKLGHLLHVEFWHQRILVLFVL